MDRTPSPVCGAIVAVLGRSVGIVEDLLIRTVPSSVRREARVLSAGISTATSVAKDGTA